MANFDVQRSVPVPGSETQTAAYQPGLTKNQWLGAEHPAYTASKHEWSRHERAMRGGSEVNCWLTRFDWEVQNGDHHKDRMNSKTWINFGDRFATLLVGHMMRQAPTPGAGLDFGTLGEVSRKNALQVPTPAELVFFNTDGSGRNGSQWDNFWTTAARWAVATGHRWIFAQGPPTAPRNRAEEINGMRPSLQSLSPLSVRNWHEEDGKLQFAVIERYVRKPVVTKDGAWESNRPQREYLLLTREGFTGFDNVNNTFRVGGWFLFDSEGTYTNTFGFWDATNGEIPLIALYYERMGVESGSIAVSRSGITEMVNASIAYMNQSSAADFEVWDAATSVKALEGVDDEGFNLFIAKVKEGNRYAPLKNNKETGKTPTITDASGGSSAASSFDLRLRAKRNEVLEFMLNEIQIAPDSSGVARQASFTDVREPRLALFAAEIETAQNSAIDMLERMWGSTNPTGSVEWPREFKLLEPLDAAVQFFTIENLAGLHSPTAGAKVLTLTARESGMIGDDEEEATILKEYEDAAKTKAKSDAAMLSLTGSLVDPSGAPATPKPATEPSPAVRNQDQTKNSKAK